MSFVPFVISLSSHFALTLTTMVDLGTKDQFVQEGILFCTQFPSLGIFINKKLDFKKTKTT